MLPADPADAHHEPVLLTEVMTGLDIRPGAAVIDCTIGGGGHTEALLKAVGSRGRVLGLDADPAAIDRVSRRFSDAYRSGHLTLCHAKFGNLGQIAPKVGFAQVDAILLDLGLSSFQLETSERGFSFRKEGPLDMRFDPKQIASAYEIVNTWSEKDLANLIYQYGEERRSRAIAKGIVGARPLRSTLELAEVVTRAVPKSSKQRIHPATRTFQALRIAVNDELVQLRQALTHSISLLNIAGRIAVISFHSLEDRIVKQWMREQAQTYVRDASHPLGGYDKKATLSIYTRKPITPSAEEIEGNPRSRSAKLRIAEKI